ncbi:MAG TPA: phage/plasmid primase, P4 family [Nitrososphaeraceae archaeon]|nr:phage/plasmid primase, P4 family [Nitrososphaeraceae archaeon]
MIDSNQMPPLDSYNDWADHWRYKIGLNVLPADSMYKKIYEKWSYYQINAVQEWQHEQWKSQNKFSKGMAIMPGKVWHRQDRAGYYFTAIDADKIDAINELCTINGNKSSLQKMSQKFIVEQHSDNLEKAHIYFYSPIPFPPKGADSVLGLEVKGLAQHGVMFCCPSIHKNGYPYKFLGTAEPPALNRIQGSELIQHLNQIYLRYGLQYLDKSNIIDVKLKTMIKRLKIDAVSNIRIHEGTRHPTLISIANSILFHHLGKKSEETLRDFFFKLNDMLCEPEPLPDREIKSIWRSAFDFVKKRRPEEEDENSREKKREDRIITITNELMENHTFKTIVDEEKILYYDSNKGLYVPTGEWIIKRQSEETCPKISSHEVQEVINHIKRRTGVERSKFDSNPSILNLQNGLLNIETGEFIEHSSDYLSVAQLPVTFDPKAKCPKILKFLGQVLSPQDVFTAMQVIGYCLYKSNKYEKAIMLCGPGSNGKGVFIKLIEALVGLDNTSHVPLQDLEKDKFAPADLYGKLVNTFADLKAEKLSTTGMFKTLVSGDTIRAQRKYGHPFSFRNYAKLFFSANKIPESDDKSYAYYKRWLILTFDMVFEGDTKDTRLIDKLTTKEELSGLLNLAIIALWQLHKHRGFRDISVERIRHAYEENANTVKAFLDAKCVIDLTESEYYTLSTNVYNEYFIFCKERKERPLEMNVFGKKLAEQGIVNERIRYYGQREHCYIGIKLRSDLRGQGQAPLC